MRPEENRWWMEDDPRGVAVGPMLPGQLFGLAEQAPDRVLAEDVGGRSVTRGEFVSEILKWMTYLQELGVGEGDTIANLLPSSIDANLLWLAAGLVGAVEVAVNRELRGEFLTHVLADSGSRFAFARPEDVHVVEQADVSGIESVVVDRTSGDVRSCDPAPTPAMPDPADLGCVLYTSGTTGPPKGVAVTWAELSTAVGRIPRSWLSADDAMYAPWPMFHLSGRTPALTMGDVGGRIVCRERASVSAFWSDLRDHGCTVSVVSPIAPLLLAAPATDGDRDHPLRIVHCGGVRAVGFQERFGVRAVTSYGSTEMGFVMVKRWADETTADSIGFPRPGYDVRLEDAAGLQASDGQVGELVIKAPVRHLMTPGYLNRSELSDQVFVDGWYHTGDAARRRDDGSFVFVDRIKDTIRRFGENISATMIEQIVNADDRVLECAVVGVPSETAGQEVGLAVVEQLGAEIDPAALFERLVPELPRYALPAYIVVVDELPKTPNGKVRRVVVRDLVTPESSWSSPVVRRSPDG